MTLKKLCFLLPLLLLLLLSGCEMEEPQEEVEPPQPRPELFQGQQPAPAPFTLAWYPDASLHPILTNNRVNLDLSPLIYESLFSVSRNFEAVPELCTSYAVDEEGLSWSFTLREGVTFSDGTPLTGALVVQALETARQSSRYAARLSQVRAMSAEGNTVLLTLDSPNRSLPVLLDIPIPLDSSQRPLGTGPFVLREEEDQDPWLQLREDYASALSPPFQSVRLFPVRQTDDLLSGFGSGEITLLSTDLTSTNALGYSGSFELWDFPTSEMIYLGFRCDKDPCKDPELRLAIARAVDREAIVDVSYAGHAVSSALPIHPNSPIYRQGVAQQLSFSPQILVELLSQGKSVEPLRLLVNSENNAKVSTAQAIAAQLQGLGLSVEVLRQPWNEYLTTLRTGEFEMYLAEAQLSADFHLDELLAGELNYSGLLPREFQSALEAWHTGERDALYTLYQQTVPLVPICFKNHSVLTQWGRLSGLNPQPYDLFYGLTGWKLDE